MTGTEVVPQPSAHVPTKGKHFLVNVLWNWTGTGLMIFFGFVLQPYIIRKLGPERYGIWALVFSLLDYLRLFDLGFRAAIINFSARYRARQDAEGVNAVLNTGSLYFGAIAVVIIAIAFSTASFFLPMFHVPAELRHEALIVGLTASVSVAIGVYSSVFSGALEGFQRFDAINHAYISGLALRSIGSAVLLYYGYGLIALGYLALTAQVVERVWNMISLKRIFPSFSLRPSFIRWDVFRGMTQYGVHSFLISIANMVSNQSPLSVIGYFRGSTAVGYFSLPLRLLMYVGEIVPRVGFVTTSKTAELDEAGQTGQLRSLAMYTNRYCYALFLPFAMFILLYGRPLLAVWVNPDFAVHSAPVLPMLTILILMTMASQFNSGAILIGQGRHRLYSYGLMVEVLLYVAALIYSVPRYGLVGAAWSMMIVMILTRCLYPAWLVCRMNDVSFMHYMLTIYGTPTLIAIPVGAAILVLRALYLPGNSWRQLIAAAAFISITYFALALWTCVLPDHRRQVWAGLSKLKLRRAAA